MLISAEKISKSYGQKPLFEDVSLYLNAGDKVGVIGINGTGKSTLLKILAGKETSDAGIISVGNGVRVGYLPQNPEFQKHISVLEQVLHASFQKSSDREEYEAKAILNKLGITDFEQDVSQLSGGQKKRVAIAAVLASPCEVLILDEPTNHIDSAMVRWLESYLQNYKGAVVMVTHDRYFLDRVSNKIAEIDRGRLYTYQANYSKFLELKALREENLAGSERKRQSILRTELEWVQRGVRARGTKSRSRLERYEELKNKEVLQPNQTLELSSVSSRLGNKIIQAHHLSKSYGDQVIVKDFSYLFLKDSRIGIVGQNGCGKSTLLKMLAGILKPDSGEVEIGQTVKIGYFSQEWEEMNPDMKVIDYITQISAYIKTKDGTLSASQMLEKFLFPPDLQWNTIGRLSGGEKRRLFLLSVIMQAPNVFLLDEPTNDLDIQTLMILENYLKDFSGAVVAVSHDRYFLDKIADTIFAFEGGGEIREYLGGYSDYLNEHENYIKLCEKEQKEKKISKNPQKRTASKLKFSFREQYDYEHIDGEIEQLENQLADILKEIEKESANFEKLETLLAEKEKLERKLEEKTERWIYLNELAEQIANQKNQ